MEHRVELLAVGTELLLGNILNTNARDLSQLLSGLGLNVYHHTVVGDNPARLTQAVAIAKGRADILITTGGLGPTCDDLTKKVVAGAFGLPLEFHPECEQSIRDYFAKSGRTMTANNLQQAYLPKGCTVLENRWGTAPGCAFCVDGVHVVMLPGPPRECLPMFREEVTPYLAQLTQGVIHSRTLRIFGLGESGVEQLLRDKMNTLQNPTLAPYAKEGEVELRITAKADSEAAARAMIAPVEADLRGEFGPLIYGADVDSLEQVVVEQLLRQEKTLATAESCTGGLIAKRITDIPGSSAVFEMGAVTYSNRIKHERIQVPQELLEKYGAVSEPVARAMAEGVRRAAGSSLGIGVTGIAGPGGGSKEKPVGLVYLALSDGQQTWVTKMPGGGRIGSRTYYRNRAASTALDMVRRYLEGKLEQMKE